MKWVFFGTPVAGNGVLEALEMGCSVICLCEDDHHKEHFLKALEQKAVESFLQGSSKAIGDADLLAKATKVLLGAQEGKTKEPGVGRTMRAR